MEHYSGINEEDSVNQLKASQPTFKASNDNKLEMYVYNAKKILICIYLFH